MRPARHRQGKTHRRMVRIEACRWGGPGCVAVGAGLCAGLVLPTAERPQNSYRARRPRHGDRPDAGPAAGAAPPEGHARPRRGARRPLLWLQATRPGLPLPGGARGIQKVGRPDGDALRLLPPRGAAQAVRAAPHGAARGCQGALGPAPRPGGAPLRVRRDLHGGGRAGGGGQDRGRRARGRRQGRRLGQRPQSSGEVRAGTLVLRRSRC
mmetsp:Transcript_31797/g.71573  ORF Transcript_31797/g.71573 Transcript_31797/m.71573 type:complete len:210 (+) Transcript_31797:1614-2243(+)